MNTTNQNAIQINMLDVFSDLLYIQKMEDCKMVFGGDIIPLVHKYNSGVTTNFEVKHIDVYIDKYENFKQYFDNLEQRVKARYKTSSLRFLLKQFSMTKAEVELYLKDHRRSYSITFRKKQPKMKMYTTNLYAETLFVMNSEEYLGKTLRQLVTTKNVNVLLDQVEAINIMKEVNGLSAKKVYSNFVLRTKDIDSLFKRQFITKSDIDYTLSHGRHNVNKPPLLLSYMVNYKNISVDEATITFYALAQLIAVVYHGAFRRSNMKWDSKRVKWL